MVVVVAALVVVVAAVVVVVVVVSFAAMVVVVVVVVVEVQPLTIIANANNTGNKRVLVIAVSNKIINFLVY